MVALPGDMVPYHEVSRNGKRRVNVSQVTENVGILKATVFE